MNFPNEIKTEGALKKVVANVLTFFADVTRGFPDCYLLREKMRLFLENKIFLGKKSSVLSFVFL